MVDILCYKSCLKILFGVLFNCETNMYILQLVVYITTLQNFYKVSSKLDIYYYNKVLKMSQTCCCSSWWGFYSSGKVANSSLKNNIGSSQMWHDFLENIRFICTSAALLGWSTIGFISLCLLWIMWLNMNLCKSNTLWKAMIYLQENIKYTMEKLCGCILCRCLWNLYIF